MLNNQTEPVDQSYITLFTVCVFSFTNIMNHVSISKPSDLRAEIWTPLLQQHVSMMVSVVYQDNSLTSSASKVSWTLLVCVRSM